MCIIATKPMGQPMIDATKMQTMFTANPDGAGYMFARDGVVHIRKGFMDYQSLKRSIGTLGDVTDTAMVFHFRIATHGGTCKENTHPFPVSGNMGDLQRYKCKTMLGMAHNGVVSGITPDKGVSDTMQFVVDYVAPLIERWPTFYLEKEGQRVLEKLAGSKLCFLDGNGEIVTLGAFNEKDGCKFSNYSYEPKPVKEYGRYTWPTTYHYSAPSVGPAKTVSIRGTVPNHLVKIALCPLYPSDWLWESKGVICPLPRTAYYDELGFIYDCTWSNVHWCYVASDSIALPNRISDLWARDGSNRLPKWTKADSTDYALDPIFTDTGTAYNEEVIEL